jgi:hypothetical protein
MSSGAPRDVADYAEAPFRTARKDPLPERVVPVARDV